MSDTSLADAITAARKREGKKKTRLIVSGVLALLVASPLVYAAVRGASNQDQQVADTVTETPPAAAYKYAYVEQKCKDGLAKYDGVAQQIVGEGKKLTALMANPTWLQNSANLVIAESVTKSNMDTLAVISDRAKRLQSCAQAAADKADFTDTQLADIDAMIAGVPSATSQPTSVGGVSIPTFAYTPYTYKAPSSNYDVPSSSTPTPAPTTAVLGAVSTPRPTATPKSCDEAQKANYKAKYDYDQGVSARQEEAEVNAYQTSHSSMAGSGLYNGAIDEIRRKYRDQSNNRTRQYNSQLASINCT